MLHKLNHQWTLWYMCEKKGGSKNIKKENTTDGNGQDANVNNVNNVNNASNNLANTTNNNNNNNNANNVNDAASSWMATLEEVNTMETVEDFWSTINNIATPSELPLKANLHLFKTGIRPMWEDKENENGGKLAVDFPKNYSLLNDLWLKIMLFCIGEQLLEDSNVICGVVVQIKSRNDRIAIWIKNTDQTSVEKIRSKLEELLKDNERKVKWEFISHKEAMGKDEAMKKQFSKA